MVDRRPPGGAVAVEVPVKDRRVVGIVEEPSPASSEGESSGYADGADRVEPVGILNDRPFH